jgi:hypothetical protein
MSYDILFYNVTSVLMNFLAEVTGVHHDIDVIGIYITTQ